MRFRLCVMVAKWLSKSERALESTATAAAPSSTTSAFSWLASAEICCRLLSKSGRRADPGSFSRKRSMTPIASSRCLRPMRNASGRFGSSRPAVPASQRRDEVVQRLPCGVDRPRQLQIGLVRDHPLARPVNRQQRERRITRKRQQQDAQGQEDLEPHPRTLACPPGAAEFPGVSQGSGANVANLRRIRH